MGVTINWLPEYSDSHLDHFTHNLVERRDGCDVATARGYATARRLNAPSSPRTHVVTLTIAKAHAHIRHSHEDELLERYLRAAERRVEWDAAVSLVEDQFAIDVAQFPSFGLGLRLPIYPVTSVDAFTSYDREGNAVAADSPIPYLLTPVGRRPQELALPLVGDAWPTDLRKTLPGYIEVTAGWAADECPDDLVEAVLMLFAHAALVREPIVTGNGVTIDQVPVAGYADYIRPWVVPGC